MKTILTTITFAIAVMVFAFGANPVMAKSGTYYCIGLPDWIDYGDCAEDQTAEIDQVSDPDEQDGGRDVADSGDEGSTAAAGANEQ